MDLDLARSRQSCHLHAMTRAASGTRPEPAAAIVEGDDLWKLTDLLALQAARRDLEPGGAIRMPRAAPIER